LDEVYVGLDAGTKFLCSVGARTVLDILIVDKIGDIGTFKDKIKKLQSDGHIIAHDRELIEAVTEAGNASAHRGFSPDASDLSELMDILEALLRKFYVEEPERRKLLRSAAGLKKRVPPRQR